MSTLTLLAVCCGIYLAYNVVVGLLLVPIYLLRERGVPLVREFLMVSLVPSIGLGVWARARERRVGRPVRAYLPRMVLVRMGLFNMPFVALSGAVLTTYAALFVRSALFSGPAPDDPALADLAEVLAEVIFLPIAAFMSGSVIVVALGIIAVLFTFLVALPLAVALFLRLTEDPG